MQTKNFTPVGRVNLGQMPKSKHTRVSSSPGRRPISCSPSLLVCSSAHTSSLLVLGEPLQPQILATSLPQPPPSPSPPPSTAAVAASVSRRRRASPPPPGAGSTSPSGSHRRPVQIRFAAVPDLPPSTYPSRPLDSFGRV